MRVALEYCCPPPPPGGFIWETHRESLLVKGVSKKIVRHDAISVGECMQFDGGRFIRSWHGMEKYESIN